MNTSIAHSLRDTAPRISSIAFAVAMALALTACGGGGGGGGGKTRPDTDVGIPTTGGGGETGPTLGDTAGGGSGGSTPLTPAQFETAEYQQGGFLSAIYASEAYAEGLSGQGVTVAVLDTGMSVNLAEFDGRIVEGGKTYNGTAGGALLPMSDFDGHGTHVAGVIGAARNGVGMHGVAWGANILPIRIDNMPLPESDYGSAFMNAHNLGARVLNNSWAMFFDIDTFANKAAVESFLPATSVALRTIAEAGNVVVFSAGNEGAVSPTFWGRLPEKLDYLQYNWITVVATGSDGRLAGYSNACGPTATQNWCLAAPGGDGVAPIISTLPDGSLGGSMGTSQATAVVSGSVAVLMEKFPTLRGESIVNRIFATANKDGVYANRELYGQGMLDLGAAASPIGALAAPAGASVPLGGEEPAQTFMPHLAGLTASKQSLLVLDSFDNAPFQVSAEAISGERRDVTDRVSQRMARQSAQSTWQSPNGAAFGFYGNGTERMMVANFGGQKLAFANDVAYERFAQAFSPLKLTSGAAMELVNPSNYADAKGFGVGFSQPVGGKWDSAVLGYTGSTFGGVESGLVAQLTRSLGGNTTLSLSGQTYSLDSNDGAGATRGFIGKGAKGASGDNLLRVTLAWQPAQNWESFGMLELGETRTKSRIGQTYAFESREKHQALTLGATHTVAPLRMAVSGLYKFQPASVERMSVTLPSWVTPEGRVITETASYSQKRSSVHTVGLHLEAVTHRNAAGRLGLSMAHNTAGKTEAMATYRLKF